MSKQKSRPVQKGLTANAKVIGIGASAGGLDAILEFFDHTPDDTGHIFVIIQHLSRDDKSLMPELLARHTKMKVFTAKNGQELKPDCIYLNHGRQNLKVDGNHLIQEKREESKSLNLPIDLFFYSLGREYKEDAVGVVLSGTGSDGSRGIRAIKEGGGLIFVQSPESAQSDGRPQASISSGLSDFIMSPNLIAKSISRYPRTKLDQTIDDNEALEFEFLKILVEIQKHTGVDFKRYKRNTLMRHMEKRININHLPSLGDYLKLIKENKMELTRLFDDFRIGVTSFFRDKEAFETLTKEVFPQLCDQKENLKTIRIWVPGCATGEEAYSVAILLEDYLQKHNLTRIDYKIFATDIDQGSLLKASLGSYHFNTSDEVDKHFLEYYFLQTGDQLQVAKRIRDRISFSKNDLLTDPPFIRMDLITCRNVLIYFEKDAQERVFNNFDLALNPGGFLFLGNSESLSKSSSNLQVINSKWRIFKRKPEAIKKKFSQNSLNVENRLVGDRNVYRKGPNSQDTHESVFYKFLSNHFSPSLLFVDADYNIRFIKGDAGKKLTSKEGIFHHNLIQMVDPSFATIIRNGVHRAKKSGQPIEVKDVFTSPCDQDRVFDLTFYEVEIEGVSEPLYIISFTNDRPKEVLNVDMESIGSQRIEDPEQELKLKKEELTNLLEEQETSNKELQSSNEELMASNEELQSVNEELHTVNTELQDKNNELRQVYNDLKHLYASQHIATLFVDRELRIRSFTPSIMKHLGLKTTDIGRPVTNFSFFDERIRESFLVAINNCLAKGTPHEQTIEDKSRRYMMRAYPFIVDENIEGAVVTLIDVEEILTTKEKLLMAESHYEHLFKRANVCFSMAEFMYDTEGNPVNLIHRRVNKEFERLLELDTSQIQDQPLEVLGFSKRVISDFVQMAHEAQTSGVPKTFSYYFECFEKHLHINVFTAGVKDWVGWTFYDITDQVVAEQQIKLTNTRLEMSNSMGKMAVWEWDIETDRIENFNKQWELIYELEPDRISEQMKVSIHEEDRKKTWNDLKNYIRGTMESQTGTFRVWSRSLFQYKWIKSTSTVIEWSDDGAPLRLLGCSVDITEEKDSVIQIEYAKEQYESLFDNLSLPFAHARLIKGSGGHPIDWEYISVNKAHEEILPFKPEELVGKRATKVLPGLFSEKEDLLQVVAETATNGTPKKLETYLETLKKHMVLNVFSPRKGEVGMTFQDQTDQIASKRALEKEKYFAEAVTESSASGIYIVDLIENKNIYSNSRCQQLLGFSSEELEKMDSDTFISRFHPEDLLALSRHTQQLAELKTSISIKYRFLHKNGHYIDCFSVDSPFEINEKGKLISYIGSFIDITELKKKEEDLVKARNDAENASKQKDLFLSNLSHEIRTPMNAVVGFAKLLRRSNLQEAEKELYLTQVEENSKQLLVLINDILDLTRIESGEFRLQPEKTDLSKLMQETYEYYSNELEKKDQLSIVLKAPKSDETSSWVLLDPIRLKQVLNNLVDNAIKYGKKGKITLSYTLLKEQIKFEVIDQGEGMAKKDQERVFKRFEQLEENELKTSGAGLGLAICRGIIHAMGGTITINSALGKGSTFTVRIPLKLARTRRVVKPAKKLAKTERGVKKVLIADDSPSIQLYYQSLLKDSGVMLLLANDGKEAVRCFENNPEIKLILMDLKMPVMNGEEAFKAIRTLDDEVPIIAQSAFAMNDEVRRFKKMGFTEYITKPIEEEKLMGLLSKYLNIAAGVAT